MKICFINPPFKAEYGKFSRESRSPSIGHSGVLYYPLWLIYAAATAEKDGFDISFIDAPAKRLDEAKTLERVKNEAPGSVCVGHKYAVHIQRRVFRRNIEKKISQK